MMSREIPVVAFVNKPVVMLASISSVPALGSKKSVAKLLTSKSDVALGPVVNPLPVPTTVTPPSTDSVNSRTISAEAGTANAIEQTMARRSEVNLRLCISELFIVKVVNIRVACN